MQAIFKLKHTEAMTLLHASAPKSMMQFMVCASVSLIVGCSSTKPAPVIERNPLNPTDAVRTVPAASTSGTVPATVPALDTRPRDPSAKIYVVKPGDSLYAIAFQNGVEYRELAAWNNIENANRIRVGQELRVNAPMASVSGAISVPSVAGVAMLPTATNGAVVSTPLITTQAPSSVPSGAIELQAAQNSATSLTNSPGNSAALKIEPKISKLPYSDAAYNRALQQVGGAPNVPMTSGNVIISGSRPAVGLSATAGAQPPLAGLPSLPPSTSTSASLTLPAPTKAAITPLAPETAASAAALAARAAATAASAAAAAVAAAAAAAASATAAAVPYPNVLTGSDMPAWMWPLASAGKPRIMATFTDLNKGIDLAGTRGQGVLAAAPGKVVYSGTAMRGYGQLVIVKHNVAWFSAYAHNDKILVAEGDAVKKGQKIAEMGATDADSVKLHFEIRKQGVPVDPLKLLPPL